MSEDKEQIISLREASKITGYSQDYLGDLCREGKLEGQKIGRNWTTTKKAVAELMGSATKEAKPEFDFWVKPLDEGNPRASENKTQFVSNFDFPSLGVVEHKNKADELDANKLEKIYKSFNTPKKKTISKIPVMLGGLAVMFLALSAVMVNITNGLWFEWGKSLAGVSVIKIFNEKVVQKDTEKNNSTALESDGKVLAVSTTRTPVLSVGPAQPSEIEIRKYIDSQFNVLVGNGLLKGPKGDKGDPGNPGAVGPAGAPGVNGASGTTTNNLQPVYIPVGVAPQSQPQNFYGASLFSATNISSENFITNTLKISSVTGTTQCLQADTNGMVSGTGNACGAGGGGSSIGGAVTGATAGSVFFAGVGGILQQDNANIFWDDAANRLGIGTNTPANKLTVAGSANITGHIAIGSGSLVDKYTANGSDYPTILHTSETMTTLDPVNGGVGIGNEITFNPSSGSGYGVYGISSEALTQAGNATNFGDIYGTYNFAGHYGSGNATSITGDLSKVYNYQTAGSVGDMYAYYANPYTNTRPVTNMYSFYGYPAFTGGGAITNGYGIYVDNSTGSPITNSYGGYFVGQTAATNNVGVLIGETGSGTKNTNLLIGTTTQPAGSYSIYNSSADNNYFAGNFGIGDISPAALLTVGNGDLFQVDTSGNTILQNQADLRFGDSDGTNYVAFQAPTTVGTNVVWTLPNADASGCFQSNGTGTISISSCGSGSMAIGGSITSATQGSVLFAGASGVLQQDNANFFWDDTNNRLAIGNASPSANLHITPASVSGTPSTSGSAFREDNYTFTDNNTAGSGTAGNMAFNSFGIPVLAATNASVTTTNAYNLYIQGGVNKGTNNTVTNSIALGIGSANVGAQTNSYGLYVNAQAGASNNYAAVFSGGNVGMGVTDPSYRLDIQGSNSSALRLRRSGSGADTELVFSNETPSPTNKWFYHMDGSSPESMFIYPAGSGQHLVLQTDEAGTSLGNVGIGVVTPSTKLDINGNAQLRAQGELRFADSDSTNYVAFKSGAIVGSNVTWTLPVADSSGCFQSNGTGTVSIASCAGSLSAISAASGDATLNNGANNIVWNWQLSGAETGMLFGENTASTGGSNNQYIVQAATLSGSTAMPLFVNNIGNGISFRVDDASGDTTPFVVDAAGNVGVGTSSPGARLQVLSAPTDFGSYSLTSWNGTGSAVSAFIKSPNNNGGSSPTTAEPALVLGRDGVSGQAYANYAELKISRWENNSTNARTRLDFALTHGVGDAAGTNIMSLRSDGRVGIGTTTPGSELQIGDGTGSRTITMRAADGNTNANVISFGDGVVGENFNINFDSAENFLTINAPSGAGQLLGLERNRGTAMFGASGEATASLQLTGNRSIFWGAQGLSGIGLRVDGVTYTDTTSSGTVTNLTVNALGTPTLAASSATTYTNSANLYIASAPAAGSNVTLTNTYALWVDDGSTRLDGSVSVLPNASTSGSPNIFTVTGPAHTSLSADTEAVDVLLGLNRTVQFSQGAGTFTRQSAVLFQAPTYAFTSADTITTAANLWIAGAPALGTNASITNNFAFLVTDSTRATNYFGITSTGRPTAPDTGTSSERFGFNSTASNTLTSAFGNGANASGAYATAIGASAAASTTNALAVGQGATASGSGAVAIGAASTAGSNARSIAIGYLATATGADNIILGDQASGESSGFSNQFIAGSSGSAMTDVYFGKGRTNGTPTAYTINGTGGSGTNIAGAALQLAGGKGTGNAGGGNIVFQTSDALASGSTLQSVTTKAILLGSGEFGIGTASPGYKLEVVRGTAGIVARFTDSDGSCDIDPTSTALSCTSDIRLKKDINDLPDNTLGRLLNVRPVSFKWNTQTDDVLRYGVIAQELEGQFPELVKTDTITGLKTVNYLGFTPFLIQAVKEQNSELSELQKQISHLQGEISGRLSSNEQVVIKSHLYLSGDSVGLAKILTGSINVKIKFSKPYEYQPIVTVTPINYDKKWKLINIDSTGFEILLSESENNEDVIFNYHVFTSPEAKLTVSDGNVYDVKLVTPVLQSAASEVVQSQENKTETEVAPEIAPVLVGENEQSPSSVDTGSEVEVEQVQSSNKVDEGNTEKGVSSLEEKPIPVGEKVSDLNEGVSMDSKQEKE